MSETDTLKRLQAIVRPHLRFLPPGAPLSADASLGEAGLDSMASIDLLLQLEDEFGIEIPDEALDENTFASLDRLRELVDGCAVA